MGRLRSQHVSDEELSLLIDGQLDAEKRRRVEAHLRTCAQCRRAYEDMRATVLLLRQAPRAVPPRAFTLTEADVMRPSRRRSRPLWLRWATGLVALALVLVVALDAFIATAPHEFGPEIVSQAPQATNVLSASPSPAVRGMAPRVAVAAPTPQKEVSVQEKRALAPVVPQEASPPSSPPPPPRYDLFKWLEVGLVGMLGVLILLHLVWRS